MDRRYRWIITAAGFALVISLIGVLFTQRPSISLPPATDASSHSNSTALTARDVTTTPPLNLSERSSTPLQSPRRTLTDGPTVTLSIDVVHADGAPAAQTAISVHQAAMPPVVARTDDNGHCIISSLPLLATGISRLFRVDILAESDNLRGFTALNIGAEGGAISACIVLGEPAGIRGYVQDQNSGIAVQAILIPNRDPDGWPRPVEALACSTDDTGYFEFSADDEGPWSFDIMADGYPRQTSPIFHTSANPVRVEVERGGAIHGTCLDSPGGNPMEGVSLRCKRLGVEFRDEWNGTTDSTGVFVFEELAPATYILTVDDPIFAITGGVQTLIVTSEGATETTVVLAEGATVEGRVRHPWSMFPDGVSALAYPLIPEERGGWPRTTNVDENGRFRITGLSVGDYRVILHDPTFRLYRCIDTTPAQITIASAGETIQVSLEAHAGARIEGIVTNADGTPAPQAMVRATGRLDADTTTDNQGRFSFECVEEGSTYLAAWTAEARTSVSAVATVVANQTTEADLQLDAPAKYRLIVTVIPVGSAAPPSYNVRVGREREDGSYERGIGATAGKGGLFVFTGLIKGDYHVTVTDAEHRQSSALAAADVSIGETNPAPRLALRVEADPKSIEGIVLDESSQPVASAELMARLGEFTSQARSAEDGTFVFSGLLPVVDEIGYEIFGREQSSGATGHVRDIYPGAKGVTIVLKEPEPIAAYVVDGNTGAPITEFEVMLSRGISQPAWELVRDPQGILTIPGGSGSLRIRAEGYDETTVEPGQLPENPVVQLTPITPAP